MLANLEFFSLPRRDCGAGVGSSDLVSQVGLRTSKFTAVVFGGDAVSAVAAYSQPHRITHNEFLKLSFTVLELSDLVLGVPPGLARLDTWAFVSI